MKFEIKNDYRICVGLNDKDTYTQIIPTSKAEEICHEIICAKIGGATFSRAFGFWVDEKGNPTAENTIVIEIADSEDNIIEEICTILRDKFNQNCVMVSKTETQIAFV